MKGLPGEVAPELPIFSELVYGDVDNAFRRTTLLLSREINKRNIPSMTGFIYSRDTNNGTPSHLCTSKHTGDYQRVLLDKEDGMSGLHFTISVDSEGSISYVNHRI